MTEEELEEEAYQYDKEHLCSGKGARWYHNVTIKEAYLAGAEPREKRIAELEAKLSEAKKLLSNLIYVVELGKNELATARLLAEARTYLEESE